MSERFENADHLPKVRGDDGEDPRTLPRQRVGVTPQMHGRFPDFDILSQPDHWDAETRAVVLARLEPPGPLRVFSAEEANALESFCDLVMHQDCDPKIPVLAMVDAKFARGQGDGFRYADMPDDPETWKRVAAGLDRAAFTRTGTSFAAATPEVQKAIVTAFAAGELTGGQWDDLNVARAWSIVMRSVLEAFYSHPWSWNEIGFGGPAYPRGYARLGAGLNETWERGEATDPDIELDTGKLQP